MKKLSFILALSFLTAGCNKDVLEPLKPPSPLVGTWTYKSYTITDCSHPIGNRDETICPSNCITITFNPDKTGSEGYPGGARASFKYYYSGSRLQICYDSGCEWYWYNTSGNTLTLSYQFEIDTCIVKKVYNK